MHYERILPVVEGDPLRYTDARFEPRDPLFDADEPPPPRMRRRRKDVAAALLAATLACGGAERPAIHASDSILVQLAPGASPPSRAQGTSESGPPIIALASLAPDDEAPLLKIPLEAGDDPVAAAEAASHRAGVEFAEPVYLYRSSRMPNDPRIRDLWGLARIDAPGAWAHSVGDRAVTVAVVDDGVALDHPDLKANLWVNPQEIAGNGIDDDGDGYADDVNGWDFVQNASAPAPASSGTGRWHGTHVAGIIGAEGDNRIGVVGVNWKASLMSLRAVGPLGGRSDDLARAVDYAADHGARVINASWSGGADSQAISRAIARAGTKGALFVAAAGNESAAKPGFPAGVGLDNLISVGATTPDDLLAPFSNRGALVAAPGVGILSTTAPGQYERYDGTSMASAHVAGLAALLFAARPEASIDEVRSAISSSAVPIDGVQHGRIDASRALAALEVGGGNGALAQSLSLSLSLSREALTFAARAGRIPRAQTISLRAAGGGRRAWTAATDAKWIVLPQTSGETPARVSVRVDPGKLDAGNHAATVIFKDGAGGSVALAIALQFGGSPAVAVQGEGCALREDGKLHVRAGAGCRLSAADGEAASVQWRLPGGEEARGSRLYAQFVRRGEFRLLVSADEGEVDAVPVVIE